MSEGNPPSSHPHQKRLLERVSYFLTGEPQDQEDLLAILRNSQEKSLLDAEALAMIEGVLRVSEMRVRDIMIPRSQMVVVDSEAELKAIFPVVVEFAHSRFPVIEEDRSKVIGVLLVKDLIVHAFSDTSRTVSSIMRPASLVPESKRLNVLLKEFRTERNHMAIVVDEYGNAAGLVTIEDILEQIVGEIEDEHDEDQVQTFISRRNEKEFLVNALTPIEDFNEYFSADFADDECDTIGGLIVQQLEHFPKKGEKINLDEFVFEVLKADNRRVHLLKMKVLD
jgi:magnesium and cobalt transporter